ncbi:hypothetical protein PspLS_11306 [Pyricularia sp. CBS 133598]|nr:hypothetical protein PspLS_11306 [Pyricularia sp. CBS 133598]
MALEPASNCDSPAKAFFIHVVSTVRQRKTDAGLDQGRTHRIILSVPVCRDVSTTYEMSCRLYTDWQVPRHGLD